MLLRCRIIVHMFVKTLVGLYSWRLPERLVSAYHVLGGSTLRYLGWFHSQKNLALPKGAQSQRNAQATRTLQLVILVWMAVILFLVVQWLSRHKDGYWAFALSVFMAYPLILAYGLALFTGAWKLAGFLLRPKKMARAVICALLEWQVRRLRKKHHFKVVAVAGSVGKTSTKLAIAQLLGQNLRVQFQEGNYNDRATVPLIFFGQSAPSLYNPFAWARVIGANESTITAPYPYDIVVVELGTDGPGQMREFAYIRPDITVVTGVTPEHMEYFKTLDAVAAEELEVFSYSKQVLVNIDETPEHYLRNLPYTGYGTMKDADYVVSTRTKGLEGQSLSVARKGRKLSGDIRYLGAHGAKIVGAAVATADVLGLSAKGIEGAMEALQPGAGRMQVLEGVKNATLIDDTYNATPVAVQAGLDVVYKAKAPQKIAILGSMNELGDYAKEAHQIVGAHCDPKELDMVLTVGVDAQRWLAPAARANGCVVHSFTSPYVAGQYAREHLKEGAVVFAKGSQNGVFTEEALKKLLRHPSDQKKLVRQSRSWLSTKAKQFKNR